MNSERYMHEVRDIFAVALIGFAGLAAPAFAVFAGGLTILPRVVERSRRHDHLYLLPRSSLRGVVLFRRLQAARRPRDAQGGALPEGKVGWRRWCCILVRLVGVLM